MRQPKAWHDVFMGMAHQIKLRSKDPSTQCGAVVVSYENTVLGVGFNGPPADVDDAGVPWQTQDKYDYIHHAEDNALYFAMQSLQRTEMYAVYVTGHPCVDCVRNLIRHRIAKVYWDDTVPQPRCVDDEMRRRIEALTALTYGDPKLIPYSTVKG